MYDGIHVYPPVINESVIIYANTSDVILIQAAATVESTSFIFPLSHQSKKYDNTKDKYAC